MKIEVKVPEVGESITEGVIVQWFKAAGAQVAKDEPLFELETDKITMQVPSPAAGRLTIVVASGDVKVGQLVGYIDGEGAQATQGASASTAAAQAPAAPAAAQAPAAPAAAQTPAAPAAVQTPAAPAAAQTPAAQTGPLSPAVRRLVAEHALEAAVIEGTGKGGRVTTGDVVDLLERRASSASTAPPVAVREETPQVSPTSLASVAPAAPLASVASAAPMASVAPGGRETRKPMSSLRRRLARRLVEVQQNAAILTTFNEVDMSAVIELRERFKERFAELHGVKLGFMSFFVKAVVAALQQVPAVNARIEGDEIVENHYYDIGIAVGTDKGLVVPVLRAVDQLSLAEVEQRIADFGKRARERRLELSELTGGVFTISNGGVYGSLFSTPIINPPQSAILGMHAIKKRPVVLGADDRIVARPMMYLALSYDHRLIDGQEAVTFLKHIVTVLEAPERILTIN